MQTFMPYEDHDRSALVLDRQRLGKQRVETLQIMKALMTNQGWVNHPATKMWAGYECGLMSYQRAMIGEWTRRGYKDTCLEKTLAIHDCSCDDPARMTPWWLGEETLHASHRSNLLRKDPAFYAMNHWSEPDDIPYVWPVTSMLV